MHLLTAHQIHKNFCSGKATASEITTYFLNRIKQFDDKIGAFLTVYHERAIKKANALDEKKKNGEKVGKLAGVPIAIKDNIHIKGELTTCASQFLKNYKAPFNSTAVQLLEEEDAIIIGKTNLDEFAMGSSTENSSFQLTTNPWNTSCTPGGSSGGSAAAVSARLCPLALGSDTGGSIRQPASLCGVVGFKPTYGRVSRYGLVAFGSSLDQIGPFATNTHDAALIMEVIGKHCMKDSTSFEVPQKHYSQMLDAPLDQTIGVPWTLLEQLDSEPRKAFEDALEKLKQLGARVIEIDLNILKYAIASYYIIATAEASTNLARFDGVRYGVRSPKAQTLDDVYDLSKEEGFGPEVKRRILLGTYVLSAGFQDAYYKKAQKVRTLMIESFHQAFQKCDLVASPVCPGAAFELGSIKDPVKMYLEDMFTIPANMAGLPSISTPNGLTQIGMPLGLQLTGPQKKDGLVLQAANTFEKGFKLHEAIPPIAK